MQAVAVFTNRGLNRLLAEGGTQAWALNPERAKKHTYVVCTQNRDDGDWGQPTHAQGQGFLIGKINAVEPSPEGREGRYIIRFDEYSEIDIPNMAYQWRNPVRYIDLDEYGIDPTKLTFKRIEQSGEPVQLAHSARPPATPPREQVSSAEEDIRPLDMSGAKKALAAFYNVPIHSVEITIRG